ncbi:MAG: M20/M25/M40 family metallo-hydrolase [Bacteroidia bacterium]|nr:M20/M25/M40 family metallo-hydrolase [Bacteroidia bacterium]
MKNILYLILIFATLFPQATQAQELDPLHQIRVDVVYLASDYMQGRETGKIGEEMAANYIATRFGQMGLSPKGESGWFQPFDFMFNTNPHAKADEGEARTGKNILAYIDNNAEYTVVIGAHYDHLGYGAFGSRSPGDSAIHNGADDNASGIAGILEIARQLKTSAAKKNNYLFMAFSGEELGLFGSKAFVKEPTLELGDINYMINLDMVGRLNKENTLVLNGVGTSPAWKDFYPKANMHGLTIKTTESGVGPSDHASFYLKEIPVVHCFTGQHQDYHKPEDDSHLINFDGIQKISDFVVQLIEDLDQQGKLEYTKTKEEERKVSRFKVSLGVMPDYTNNEEGMRIDAVLDGRPAQQAGLKGGDIIIQLGETKVTDIYTYMEALSKFSAGDKAKVKVKRGEEIVVSKVQF